MALLQLLEHAPAVLCGEGAERQSGDTFDKQFQTGVMSIAWRILLLNRTFSSTQLGNRAFFYLASVTVSWFFFFPLGWYRSCGIFNAELCPKLAWKLKSVKNVAVLLRNKSWKEHTEPKI